MAENIEIKARAANWTAQVAKARSLADSTELLIQEDVFFGCKEGRLKLRMLQKGKEDYMVAYSRPDKAGPKSSKFTISPVKDSRSMRKLLGDALGETQVVKKKRRLFMVGQTRLHFDEVSGLGRFIELEVCLKKGQSAASGAKIAEDLMGKLGISKKDLLTGAYADLRPS